MCIKAWSLGTVVMVVFIMYELYLKDVAQVSLKFISAWRIWSLHSEEKYSRPFKEE